MKIKSLLIPLIKPEIDLLKNWLFHCPAAGERGFTIYLSIDTCWSEKDQEEVTSVFERSHLATEGVQLVFINCKMTRDESFYIKDPKQDVNLDKYPYGQKSGPNKQFFRSIQALIESPASDGAVLLMETDAFPVKNYWLSLLNVEVKKLPEGTLIAGSNYRGKSRLSPQISGHLNGNSIYFLAGNEFKNFLDSWDSLLLKGLHVVPYLAYDIVIPWYANHRNTNKKVASLGNEKTKQLVKHFNSCCVTLPELMINYGGAAESASDYSFKALAFSREHPKALVLHGKCFIKNIYELRNIYAKKQKVSNTSKWQRLVSSLTSFLGINNIVDTSYAFSKNDDTNQALLSGFITPENSLELIKDISYLPDSQRELIKGISYLPNSPHDLINDPPRLSGSQSESLKSGALS